jgi:single-strand DNA-binding protein
MIRAAIHGRIGSDPVQRETRNGKSMVTASVAVNVAKPGEASVSEWMSIVAFGAAGELLAQHAKGDLISAMGALTRSTFTGRDGQERTSWSLLAEAVLSARTVRSRARRDTSAAARPTGSRRTPARPSQPGGNSGPLPDDPVHDLYADGLVP